MRFGVIGTGRITRRLVADLQSTDGVSVTCVASRDSERARWFASQYGVANSVGAYQELLCREDVDAVYIALPPSMHTEWCVASAQAGKHVLCEKPLATTAREVITIWDACRDAGVRWLDATGWLHHARTKEMLRVCREGRLGTIGHVSASISFHRPFQDGEHRLDPALGGGCVLDLGWYVAGIAQKFGATPQRIFATSVRENGASLRSTAILWMNGGASATLSCGYDTATRKWFEIAGSDASLICDDFSRPWIERPTRYWIHDASGKVETHEVSDHQEIRMIESFVGTTPLTEFHQDAIVTQSVLDAWSQSSETGQVVNIELPI